MRGGEKVSCEAICGDEFGAEERNWGRLVEIVEMWAATGHEGWAGNWMRMTFGSLISVEFVLMVTWNE